MTTIEVGESKRSWSLHSNLLCYHSTYFEDQIVKEHHENGNTLELPEDDPGAFELLVKWLYQGRIDDVSALPVEKKWEYAETCQKLYMLCDRVSLPDLKNYAIDQFRKGCFEAGLVPGPEEMRPVYENTPPSSPFRKLISKIAARQIMDPESQNNADTYKMCFESNADFAIDVVNAIKEGSGTKLFTDPTEARGCAFHEHTGTKTCNAG